MLRRVIAVTALLGLAACTDAPGISQSPSSMVTSWDKMAYVNPMFKPQWGTMKSLEQPGIY